MEILSTAGLEDYELLDTGDGHRLERFGKYILVRLDPQIIWKPTLSKTGWLKTDAISASSLMLENCLKDFAKDLGGTIEAGELALEEK